MSAILVRDPDNALHTIGRYEIETLVAEGGMADVYVARDPRMKRRVAIKLLKSLFSDDPSIRRRFQREAEAVASLEHPAIIPIYDFGDHEDLPYFVMRYVTGGTLRERIHNAAMSLRDLTPVISRVAEALDAAHEQDLIHRDVKPANILFDDEGQAYLSDFGIVKGGDAVHETGTLVIGTPQYMSPEQAQARTLDRSTDVYSLGVVAFHAAAGRAPFEAKSALAMAMAHVMNPVPPIRDFLPSLPRVADEVFARALEKEPERRYPSAGAFARDLEDLASGRWYLVKLASRIKDDDEPAAPRRAASRKTADPVPSPSPAPSREATTRVDLDLSRESGPEPELDDDAPGMSQLHDTEVWSPDQLEELLRRRQAEPADED